MIVRETLFTFDNYHVTCSSKRLFVYSFLFYEHTLGHILLQTATVFSETCFWCRYLCSVLCADAIGSWVCLILNCLVQLRCKNYLKKIYIFPVHPPRICVFPIHLFSAHLYSICLLLDCLFPELGLLLIYLFPVHLFPICLLNCASLAVLKSPVPVLPII